MHRRAIVRHDCLREDRVHPVTRGLETVDGQAWCVRGDIAHPLIMYVVGPARLDEPVEGALDQNVAQVEG